MGMKPITSDDTVKALQTGRNVKFLRMYKALISKGWKDSVQFRQVCSVLFSEGYVMGVDHASTINERAIEQILGKLL